MSRRREERLTPNEKLHNAIQGALKATIDAHGPITRQDIASAMKRMRRGTHLALQEIIAEATAERKGGFINLVSSSGTCSFCGKPYAYQYDSSARPAITGVGSSEPVQTAHMECLEAHSEGQREGDHA